MGLLLPSKVLLKNPNMGYGKKLLKHKALPLILILKTQKVQTFFTVVSRQTPCSSQSLKSKELALILLDLDI